MQGAREWASESDEGSVSDAGGEVGSAPCGEDRRPREDHPTLAAYRARARRSNLWSPRRYECFRELVGELDDEGVAEGLTNTEEEAGDGVVTVEEEAGVGTVVRFHPAAVRGDARRSQKKAFRTLCDFWMREAEDVSIGELHVHLESVTSSEVARIMSCASGADVRLGIGIWSTLPCRVGIVRVHEPLSPPWAWSAARLVLPQLLPRKVLAKTAFLQPDRAASEQREVDG
jgi:hypothetical protein